ncbi:hypothetical protein SAY87_012198 [Trapa incisa]|uniref:VQ domain-containing protein n=1 Tax=Trapa incisa TaxID=236973 RepID=A0AAN7GH35_9MYRT|nr:hypothetical protein SAY87_012198 [Trapa incisa]
MTQTMSHPNDWAQFYRQISFSDQADAPPPPPPLLSVTGLLQSPETTSSIAAVTSVSSADTAFNPAQGSSSSGAAAATLCPGGRVSKPKRRRSRASRRTPTTVMSTDTTNFRAMVQQFTGGPAALFLPGAGGPRPPSALNINFGIDVPAGVRAQAASHLATFHHGQHPLQRHADHQPPVIGGLMQDQVLANMLSLDCSTGAGAGASPEIPPRPPFMQ